MAFKPTESKAKVKWNRESWQSIKKIFSYMLPYKWQFFFGMVSLAIGSVMFMIFPAAAGEMANTAAGKSKYNFELKDFGYFFAVLLIVQGVFSYFRSYLMAVVSEKGMGQLRKDLYEAMIGQPVSFFEKNRVGELTSRITADVAQIQDVISVTLAEFIRQLITLLIGVAILAWITPRLSLIMLLTFPLIVLSALIFGRYIRKLSKKRQAEIAASNVVAEESLHAYQVVKAFTNEIFERNRYSNIINKVIEVSLQFAKIKGVFFIFLVTFLFGGMFFILYEGALMVQKGQMAIGDLFSFIIYTGIIGGSMASLGTFYTTIAGALGASDRILEILQQDPEIHPTRDEARPVKSIKLVGDIRFEKVVFAYPTRPEKNVLESIDLVFEEKKKTALVGPSGAGKSTIIQLLMRFHEPVNGRIVIGEQDIYSLDLLAYRKNFAIVPQDILLFGGSIRENIAYGNPAADDDAIIEAARKANAMEFISSFPEGMETLVGDRGVRLSGGQKQRIAIARAILKDPKILILDEATSSLDAGSERLVQEALDNLMKGRTSIIIAHRLATIKNVDKIVVLKEGHIIEEGTHNTLLSDPESIYGMMAKMQMLEIN